MNNWTTIITFSYSHDAHLAKSRLEAEDIDVFLKDELSVQVQNHLVNALGGIKLQVRENDISKAEYVLKTLGYKIGVKESTPFLSKVNSLTGNVPFIGNLAVEIRLLVLVAVILIILAIPLYLWIMPNAL